MDISCRIAILVEDQSEENFYSIYCAKGGNLSDVGFTLVRYYKDNDSVCELIKLGDTEYICSSLYSTHFWSIRDTNMTPRKDLGILDLLDSWNTRGERYLYVYYNNKWWVFENGLFYDLKKKLFSWEI